MASDVEVRTCLDELRQMRTEQAEVGADFPTAPWAAVNQRRVAALDKAISALEARETQRCQQPSRILPGRACLNVLPCKTHGMEAQPKVEGRMDDVSMITTIRLLADVRLNLAYGHSPEEAESDEHKAVRLIEDECVRARASEAALSERVATLEKALEECRIHHLDPREDSE